MGHDPAVWVQPPPAPVLRVVNPVARRLLRSRLGTLLPSTLAVLEFSGRRSGRRYAVPVGVHEVHGAQVVFTEAPWRLNFADEHAATVRRGADHRTGTGVLDRDPQAVADALGAVVERIGARNLAMRTTPGHRITRADLVGLRRGMVRLQLE